MVSLKFSLHFNQLKKTSEWFKTFIPKNPLFPLFYLKLLPGGKLFEPALVYSKCRKKNLLIPGLCCTS